MYSSHPLLGPAPLHHHLEAEVQVGCGVLWVLVEAGCHYTGHLFPNLKNTNIEDDLGYYD